MSRYLSCARANPDELSHYGIMGMHWHIRRFQPYPDGSVNGKFIGRGRMARKAKRSLNANAYQVAAAKYGLKRSNDKYTKYAGKSAASRFGSRKEAKWNKKVDKEKRDIEFYNKIINEGHDAINKTVDSMKNQNFDVSFKEKNAKVLDRGRYALGWIVAGPIGGVIASPSVKTQSYKVKDKGDPVLAKDLEFENKIYEKAARSDPKSMLKNEPDYDRDTNGKIIDNAKNRKLSGTEGSSYTPQEASEIWKSLAQDYIDVENEYLRRKR